MKTNNTLSTVARLMEVPNKSIKIVEKLKEVFDAEYNQQFPSANIATAYYLSPEEVNIGMNIGKLNAIKQFKKRTFLSLMDSKYSVEKYFENAGLKFKTFD